MFCMNCGNQIANGQNKCLQCGGTYSDKIIESDYEYHINRSKFLKKKSEQIFFIGFLILFGGCIIFAYMLNVFNNIWIGLAIGLPIPIWGFVKIVQAIIMQGVSTDEMAYAGGHTKESWAIEKQKIHEEVVRKNEEEKYAREQLAEAIAKELKK